ncbi:MAG: helix-turn-helix domain-containing protein [Parafilimonas terrae]|nr:helix-turn-helix domain-containing protein [Parafilimonas terrae]
MTESTTHPTWGYRPDGSAEIFNLGPGESLPDGWHPSPDVITDPARATAEALSATVARAAQTPRRPGAERTTLDASAIAALQAENARLAAENAELRQALAASQTAHVEALGHIEVLALQLKEALASAPSTENEEDSVQPDATPSPAGSPPARTREEARAAVRALLGEGLPAREIARRVGVSPSTVAAVKAETERTGA